MNNFYFYFFGQPNGTFRRLVEFYRETICPINTRQTNVASENKKKENKTESDIIFSPLTAGVSVLLVSYLTVNKC